MTTAEIEKRMEHVETMPTRGSGAAEQILKECAMALWEGTRQLIILREQLDEITEPAGVDPDGPRRLRR